MKKEGWLVAQNTIKVSCLVRYDDKVLQGDDKILLWKRISKDIQKLSLSGTASGDELPSVMRPVQKHECHQYSGAMKNHVMLLCDLTVRMGTEEE